MKIKYLNENGTIGTKCPHGVKVSKVLPVTVYTGSTHCIKKCNKFQKIENGYVFCKDNKKVNNNNEEQKYEKIFNNKESKVITDSDIVFLTDNF